MPFRSFARAQGWPRSLWFFVATAAVFLLQCIPGTGIFLMMMLAAFWSVILINLGFIGISVEALFGKVSRLWLILPLAYFGGYYLTRAAEQSVLSQLQSELVSHNAGQSVAFDQSKHDLMIEEGVGHIHPAAFEFIQRYGLRRVFDGNYVHLMGDREACALIRGDERYRSAGMKAVGFYREGKPGLRGPVEGYCSISAPDKPDRPVVRVISHEWAGRRRFIPLRITTFRIKHEASGEEVEVRSGSARLLKRFPTPAIGCALNGRDASWDCFAQFMRSPPVSIQTGGNAPEGQGIVAAALGLKPSGDYASVASGAGAVLPFIQAAENRETQKEMAILRRMLADPTGNRVDEWIYHLQDRPEVIAPFAGRIFSALRTLQTSDSRESQTGQQLWKLAAVLPEAALAPHRREMVEWLKPNNARPWTQQSDDIYLRLNGLNSDEREIILGRLETNQFSLGSGLLSTFCRTGAAAPDEVKQRLLALWRKRTGSGPPADRQRSAEDVPLYFTLARLGLKEQAGKVEQRYFGPTFAAIWSEVTPSVPDDLCSGTATEIRIRFRQR